MKLPKIPSIVLRLSIFVVLAAVVDDAAAVLEAAVVAVVVAAEVVAEGTVEENDSTSPVDHVIVKLVGATPPVILLTVPVLAPVE